MPPSFSLGNAASVDIGRLADIGKYMQFCDAWRSKADEIPITGESASDLRKQELRLRAKAVEPLMIGIGPGADSIDAIISTVKHLSGPTRMGDRIMKPLPTAAAHV